MKNTPKQGYKIVKSLFGNEEIPEEWEIKNLGTISELFVPMRDKPKQFDGDIPWLRIEDLDDKFASDSKSHQRVSKSTVENMNLRIYPVGTVLCSCSATIGVCAITTRELITNQTFIGIFPTSQLDKEFLYYYLLTQKNNLKRIGSGSTILYISREKFESLPILLPSKSEQQKIASILSNIDSLIQQIQKEIEHTQRVKNGLMQKLLTQGIGHTKFKKVKWLFGKEIEIPETWMIYNLEHLVEILDSQRVPIEESDRNERHGKYPYYGASGIIDHIDDFIFDEKLLCLAEDGENLRSRVLPIAFTIEGKTWVNNHAHVLKPKNLIIDHTYLELFLNQLKYEKYLAYTAQPKLTQKDMKKILVITPPIPEQQKISRILSNEGSKIEKLKQQKLKFESLKKGLMQKLLTGQIRVKV